MFVHSSISFFNAYLKYFTIVNTKDIVIYIIYE
nr:MAG TPA: hypothetical protein [Caudoviricetes sp.]